MIGKFRPRNTLGILLGVLAALAVATPLTLDAQSTSGSTPSGQQPKPGKISEADLNKIRQLEVKSGARTKAAEAPEVQSLKGPPTAKKSSTS